MQGLTHSARGTDGLTLQYLCMHVCTFVPHASLNVTCSFTCLLWKVACLIILPSLCDLALIRFAGMQPTCPPTSTVHTSMSENVNTQHCPPTWTHITHQGTDSEVTVCRLQLVCQEWLLPVVNSVMWHMAQIYYMLLQTHKQRGAVVLSVVHVDMKTDVTLVTKAAANNYVWSKFSW